MPRIFERLAGALSGGRERRVRGVADQQYVAAVPCVDRVQIVHADLRERVRWRRTYHVRDGRRPRREAPFQHPARIVFRRIAPVGFRPCRRPVHAMPVQRDDAEAFARAPVIEYRHFVDQRRIALRDADPVDEALIDGGVVADHMTSRDGVHAAVRADHEIGGDRRAVVEANDGATVRAGIDGRCAVAEADLDAARGEVPGQHGLQVAPQDRHRREAHAAVERADLGGLEQGAVPVDAPHRMQAAAGLDDVRQQAELGEDEAGIRPQHHACAHRRFRRPAFVQPDLVAAPGERECGAHAGHAGAQDCNVHDAPCLCRANARWPRVRARASH